MIAAVGRFEMRPLVDALRAMAANANPDYDHELRSEGSELTHDCGWGVVFREGDRLVRRRSAASCLSDPGFDELSGIRTDLAILDVRRTPDRSTIDVLNSHPFLQKWRGEEWAFCHNGAVADLTQFTSDSTLTLTGSVDSEVMFHHVLTLLDTGSPAQSLAEILGRVTGFTCLNSFLATSGRIVAHARMSPDTPRPRYYTMWHGRGDGFSLVSSETFGSAVDRWSAVPGGTSLVLTP